MKPRTINEEKVWVWHHDIDEQLYEDVINIDGLGKPYKNLEAVYEEFIDTVAGADAEAFLTWLFYKG